MPSGVAPTGSTVSVTGSKEVSQKQLSESIASKPTGSTHTHAAAPRDDTVTVSCPSHVPTVSSSRGSGRRRCFIGTKATTEESRRPSGYSNSASANASFSRPRISPSSSTGSPRATPNAAQVSTVDDEYIVASSMSLSDTVTRTDTAERVSFCTKGVTVRPSRARLPATGAKKRRAA